MEFHIRTAEKKDADLVLDFIRKIAAYEHMSEEVTATKELLETYIFDNKAASVLIAQQDGQPIGFALFFENFSTFVGKTGIHLEDLYVNEDKRGMGVGKALFQAVAKEAVNRGCERVEWSCLNWNTPSIAFYRALGAVPMSDWTVYRLSGDTLRNCLEQ